MAIGAAAQNIVLTTDKTTSLVFPFAIRHVDRGSKDLLVQPLKEADHIILVKAGRQNFEPTNLSVITSDGSIYSFNVQYEAMPGQLVYHIPALQDASMERYADGILDNPRRLWGVQDRSWNMEGAVTGIYIRENIIYYQLRLRNKTALDYDIDQLRFYIRDQKKGKRTASQETEYQPLHTSGNACRVRAGGINNIVVALDRFTLSPGKYLVIELTEKNGGRNLQLKVRNQKIIRAIPLAALR